MTERSIGRGGLLVGLAMAWTAGALLAAEPPQAGPLAEARALFLRGKYAEAQEAFEQLADAEPLAAALGRARCQRAVGEYDAALATLREALKAAEPLAPSPPKQPAAEPPDAEKKPDAAAQQAAAARQALVAKLHAEVAELLLERGDYAAAEGAVAAALKADENSAPARWLAAELDRLAGRLDEARAGYEWLVEFYNRTDQFDDPDVLRAVGLGAAQFARWDRLTDQFRFLVNELWPDALAADPAYWPARLESGRLYLEKYNEAEAARDLEAALELNPNAAEVYVALGELAVQNYQLERARQAAERALELNPQLLGGHLVRADTHLANFEALEAIEVLEAARKLNPVSEPLLGRLAAAYAVVDGLRDDPSGTRYGKLIEEATGRNPHAGEFFLALGTGLDQARRFPAAARYYREAVERMPQLTAPRGQLGMMLMRLGEEVEARRLLEESFEVDPFNVRVNNMLKVLEVLEGYATLETAHFVIRFDRGQDELLAQYASEYLEQEVYPELTKKFGFEPEGKSLFEIFSRARNTDGHGWFSARMVGLPYVGTVGACAGKMVALASPNDMPEKYHWGRVLKHEFVHVLNLQQSRFNIPHWYTEALAVESEGYPRPAVWNQLLAERVPAGQLFNLDTINLGFVRPKSSLDWQMAYCQAQLYAQYLTATYGPDAQARLLAAYADNLPTRAALRRCFDVEQPDFERGYRAFLDKLAQELRQGAQRKEREFAELVRAQEAAPEDPDACAELGYALLGRRDYARARKLAATALDAQPRHALASYVLARVRLVVGETDEALALLEAGLDRDNPQENLLGLLAALKLKAGDTEAAAELYRLGVAKFPYDEQWRKLLARAYLTAGDNTRLEPVLEELALLDADDLTMRKKLAQLALAAGDFNEAARWARDGLFIDVQDAEVHRMLAEARRGQDRPADAAREYGVAVRLAPDEPALRVAWAESLVEAKLLDEARRVVDDLAAKFPDHPELARLRETVKP